MIAPQSVLRPPSSVVRPPSSGPLPPIVGFCGQAGAGKTTAALELVTTYDYHRISFADPIRRMLLAMGLTPADLSVNKEVPHHLLAGKTPRAAMQTLGTEWGRDRIDADLWLRLARHNAVRILDLGHLVVFDDVRFDNEARLIRALGGQVIRIIRRSQPPAAAGHASEAGIDPDLVSATLFAEDFLQLQHVIHVHFNGLAGAGPL